MILENYEYLLVEPFNIRKIGRKASCRDDEPVVIPVLAGICGSDILYFRGEKDKRKLQQRLPLVPLHEGVVRGVNNGGYGAIIPFKNCNKCHACLSGMENLCERSVYMGSTAPGLSRNMLSYPKDLILDIPPGVPLETATLLEPMSIILRMIEDIPIEEDQHVAVIGTGLMGRLVVIFLSLVKGVTRERLYLFGRSSKKLSKFEDLCVTANFVADRSLIRTHSGRYSIVIEAVGGHFMSHSLDLAITLVRPGGKICVIGLSDEVNHVNFTRIVNKGISIMGFSRARYADFRKMMGLLETDKRFIGLTNRLIDPETITVRDENDLMDAFHYAMSGNNDGRVIVSFV